jgi:hypothetical protein
VLRVLHLLASFFCHSDCLSCASFIYLSPCPSSCCASPFYLLLVSHYIARPSSICSRCRHLVDCTCMSVVCCLRAPLFVVHRGHRGEERGSDSLASWEDKRIDVVASSWRYFSTQSIISLHTPTFPHIRRPALRPTRVTTPRERDPARDCSAETRPTSATNNDIARTIGSG